MAIALGIQIFKLRNADPAQVAKILQELFRGGRPFGAVPDLRTRSVVVRADSEYLAIVRDVVAELDKE